MWLILGFDVRWFCMKKSITNPLNRFTFATHRIYRGTDLEIRRGQGLKTPIREEWQGFCPSSNSYTRLEDECIQGQTLRLAWPSQTQHQAGHDQEVVAVHVPKWEVEASYQPWPFQIVVGRPLDSHITDPLRFPKARIKSNSSQSQLPVSWVYLNEEKKEWLFTKIDDVVFTPYRFCFLYIWYNTGINLVYTII